MKKNRLIGLISFIAVIVISLTTFQACNDDHDHDHDHDDHDHETVKTEMLTTLDIKVEGMTCTGCEKHITTAIMELDGINHAKLSHTAGNAIVEFDKSKTNKEKIVDAINASGYKVVE